MIIPGSLLFIFLSCLSQGPGSQGELGSRPDEEPEPWRWIAVLPLWLGSPRHVPPPASQLQTFLGQPPSVAVLCCVLLDSPLLATLQATEVRELGVEALNFQSPTLQFQAGPHPMTKKAGPPTPRNPACASKAGTQSLHQLLCDFGGKPPLGASFHHQKELEDPHWAGESVTSTEAAEFFPHLLEESWGKGGSLNPQDHQGSQ